MALNSLFKIVKSLERAERRTWIISRMFSFGGLSRRYLWFGRLHVVTGTFFFAAFEFVLHLTSLIAYPILIWQSNVTWPKSRANYLSFMTFVQWEQLASDIYEPQTFISGFNASSTSTGSNYFHFSYGKICLQ